MCGKELVVRKEAGETRSDSSPPVVGGGESRSDARPTRYLKDDWPCGKDQGVAARPQFLRSYNRNETGGSGRCMPKAKRRRDSIR